MDGYLLISLSVLMFIGSFLVGLVPLTFNMSEGRTRLLSTFGAGLLVGTALSVVVPEGVESLYLAQTVLYLKSFLYFAEIQKDDEHGHLKVEVDVMAIKKSVGYSLVTGFIFMFIIDQISRFLQSKGYNYSIFIFLADGVALGSASTTNRTDVQFVVFFAVILHKAPAALGLVSFLLVEGVERFRIRRHLFAFSIAAPLTTFVTYYLIIIEHDALSSNSTTGILMLFSAGTFLYVATVHILPELVNNSGYHELLNNDVESTGRGRASLTFNEFVSVIIGSICPLLLISGHSHSH
ncbi:unnamed protein product [Thelazia callipaeda]|uniref:Zinc transporter ZIP9 n=1 Tax=Thelazia callipaeda TaxID=103827 RepID=A0A0N5D561_THECL|nr:unnamed protein product [Thelazia callipaeda]